MTHFNRKIQLLNTLQSIQNQPDAKKLTEIIIVDDVSKVPLQLTDFSDFDLDIKLISVQTKNKWWVNPCVAFNTAFYFIHGERVIIQNAECMHATNIIQYTIDNLQPNEYIAMSALGLTEEATKLINRETSPAEIKRDGGEWYCHSKHRRKAFNFCAAIHASDLRKVGGFDPRFSEGVYHDDEMFLNSLSKNNIKIRIEDSQLVFHQWHESVWKTIDNFDSKLKRNKQLLELNKYVSVK